MQETEPVVARLPHELVIPLRVDQANALGGGYSGLLSGIASPHDVHVTPPIPKPALVLLVGPSGAGKSTFARANFRPTEIISSDELRERVSDDSTDQGASADAFRILALLVDARLKRRLTAVVDATNLRARNRKQLAALGARHGVPVVAIAFDLPEQAFYDNNARRPDRRVDAAVIDHHVNLMRQALLDLPDEGYAAVHVIGQGGSPG